MHYTDTLLPVCIHVYLDEGTPSLILYEIVYIYIYILYTFRTVSNHLSLFRRLCLPCLLLLFPTKFRRLPSSPVMSPDDKSPS